MTGFMLHPRSLLLAFGLLATLASAASSQTAAPAPDKAAAKKLVLEKGTSADNILKAYGTPYKVLPLDSADKSLKAETWVYRRKAGETVTQEHLSDSVETYNFTVNSTNGNGSVQSVKISTPVLKSKRVTTYQVTSLLIIDGRLEIAKVQQEREESYL